MHYESHSLTFSSAFSRGMGGGRKCNERSRRVMDDGRNDTRALYDNSRHRALLCRHGTKEKCFIRRDAELCNLLLDYDCLVCLRLLSRFTEGNFFIGGFDKVFLHGIGINTMQGSIPEMLFMMFQMTFAILTPALMCGAFAERMKFSALFLFMVLWSLFCYVPICHWVWGPDGWLAAAGALDYAGGTVVHINAGVAGLVACLMLGKRIGYGKEAMAPHNLILAMVGACFLWIGWFGFNGGSGLAADGRAVMAIVVSQIAAAAAALIWMACEYVENKRFTVLGAISGAVAGLVAITPASGFVEPAPALFIGLCGGFICYFGATRLKHWLGYDDSLDAFGVHGVGGIAGAILTGVFASEAITGSAMKPVLEQVWIQTESVIATLIYASIVTYVLLKLVDVMIGIRVSAEEERMGLDLSLHGERVE